MKRVFSRASGIAKKSLAARASFSIQNLYDIVRITTFSRFLPFIGSNGRPIRRAGAADADKDKTILQVKREIFHSVPPKPRAIIQL
ncbi:hypothetical protein DLM86_05115 [Paenibacillus flagellatus]|uniref:Uncharacterized protein n=1 Tax=Paenibacillus flagellatus TaxID=2211139 RepID=A0A2V5KA00_9BACL|nr:hypothetical protein DLM86_05115 [Paenibacillus flagellatus]